MSHNAKYATIVNYSFFADCKAVSDRLAIFQRKIAISVVGN